MNHPLVNIPLTQGIKCRKLCQAIDLYGINPNLLIFGNQKYSSILGSLLTIIASTLTFGYLVQQVQELVYKQLPQTILSEHLVTETSPFPLENHNFTLSISVANMEQNPLKTIDKYFTIKVENCQRSRQLNTTTNKIDVVNTCINYPTEACASDNFVTDIQKEYFSKIRLGTAQCIKKDILQSKPPVLQGIVSGNLYSYITIKFSACKNSTEKQDCASRDEINKELINGYYVVHMSDSLIQMSNPESIQKNFIKMQYTQFSISTSKTIYQGFRIIQSLTDDGVLINNVVEDSFLVQQYYQESTADYNEDYLILHSLILDNKYTNYQRSYIKLLTILSKIGGLWQLIFIFFGIISKPFILTEMKINLANKLFRFQQEENDLTQSIKRDVSMKSNVEKYVRQPQHKLSSSISSIIQFLFGCNKARIKQLDQANLKIQENLDVVEIMKKFQEFDNLKSIILTTNQRVLFDIIPIPLITNIQNKIETDSQSSQRQSKDNFERFIEAYKSFCQIRDMSDTIENIGQKIITHLDQDMIKLFYEYHLDSEQKQVLQLLSEERKSKILDRNYLDSESKISLSPCNSNHQEVQAVKIFLNNQQIKRKLGSLQM
ncbi:unnamed protein product (macronuclear) [Paramecium tetraurelia]|uniref:Uncharacterized protein n=1 Tax=Paramecium tetraurelia TaxID=5888 RepID=A0BSB5_PARTE|nr:uncharacterized protein GSPATT00031663001 [Paramecium tetraurelia]CAK61432.1 unnamed protein product [Paramecium tetraurelia]|eukprot:XP_001428830.1 hypothetical protein (macronuclear) [Paramecium tetraurelia strain d4-2]